VLEQLALVARGGLRDALSLLDQLSAYATGPLTLDVARAALSLPSVEAVRGALEGMTRRDPAAVMALLSDVAEGGADVRLFVDELLVHLRALLLLRTGADARLADELPTDEVAWLRERAPAWSVGALLRLVQTLSEALARTRDAQQFQIQAEVALLEACEVAATASEPVPPSTSPSTQPVASNTTPPTQPVASGTTPPKQPEPSSAAAPAQERHAAAPRAAPDQESALAARWPDVVDHVKSRNPLLASLLGRAAPLRLDGNVVVVGFQTDFNRKSAESSSNRRIIEDALSRALGQSVRLRGTLAAGDGSPSLLDDPVINFAARTFGGEPRRLES
jgi:DNA polymerase-3 subunit gamma/tau